MLVHIDVVAALLLAVLFTGVAHAADTTPSEASVLSCSPTEAAPGENITCAIHARDTLQEPASVSSTTDFTVSAEAEHASSVALQVSPLRRTDDPTVLTFTVSSIVGTRVVIRAAIPSTMAPIRGSGTQALIFAAPPTQLGDITCDATSLALRGSVACSVSATDDRGVPALATSGDVFFSEDHGDGAFDMLSGNGAVVFEYRAPNALSSAYQVFSLRVGLTQSPSTRNITLNVVFPAEPPSTMSTMRCTESGGDGVRCVVNAAGNTGPVAFNPDDFSVVFEQRRVAPAGNESNSAWTTGSSMASQWLPRGAGELVSVGSLEARQAVLNAVLEVRVHVRLTATGGEVEGSPHVFRSGVAPEAKDITLQRCLRTYLVASLRTTCVLTVEDGVAAAPEYVDVGLASGLGVLSPVMFLTGDGEATSGSLIFNYTAPEAATTRIDVVVTISVGGEAVRRSPARLVVFSNDVHEQVVEGSTARLHAIAFGWCFFGLCYVLGIVSCYRRYTTLRRVKANRRERELRAEEAEEPQEMDVPDVHVRDIRPFERSTEVASSSKYPGGDDEAAGLRKE